LHSNTASYLASFEPLIPQLHSHSSLFASIRNSDYALDKLKLSTTLPEILGIFDLQGHKTKPTHLFHYLLSFERNYFQPRFSLLCFLDLQLPFKKDKMEITLLVFADYRTSLYSLVLCLFSDKTDPHCLVESILKE